MERPPLELGDLVEHWTLVGKERGPGAAKNSDTQLGFALLLLKFYGRFGKFPRGRNKLHDDAVEFVARQLGVSAGSVGFYEWSGLTIKRHRAEIRAHFGFRECSVADAGWLAGCVCRKPVPSGQMHRSSPSAWSHLWRRAAGVGRAGVR